MKHRVFIFGAFIVYILGMTAVMIWQGIGIAPDRYAFVLLLGSLLVGRTRSFIIDWIPFLFILISYDFLRGFANNLAFRVHILELINADRFLFGEVPTVFLQSHFYKNLSPTLIDYVATIFYFLHFALPLAFGFFLWLDKKDNFRRFVTGILLLSYAGWITYVIFPAAPPWMAAQMGFLNGVHKILDVTLQSFPDRFNLPTIYHNINPNPVAAFPSMHAAYPMLVLLFCIKFFKWKGLLFLPYVLMVWFSIVYLGEHYVVDVISGVLYATLFFLVANWLHDRVKYLSWLRKKIDRS